MATVSENCLNCAVGKVFYFTGIMGISTTIYNCNHTNDEVVRAKSAFFYLKKFSAVFSLLIIFVSNYYATKKTCEAAKNNISIFDLLLRCSDNVLYIIASTIIIHSMSQHDRTNNLFIFFDSILKDFTTRTSCCLLSKDDVIRFRSRMYIFLIVVILLFSSAAVCLFSTEIDPVWSTTERLGLLLSVYACFMLICIALMFLRFSNYTNKKYKRFLKMDLENLINDWSSPAYENENYRIIACPRENVLKLLKVYSDTFIEFNKIFKAFNKACNPILLISILFIIFFCVISVFLVIVCIERNTSVTLRFLSAQFGMQCLILATGYTIVKFAKLNTMNEEELTLLRKFPLSRLNSSENLQFECFLYLVERYQTKLSASDVTPIDIPLFASVLSTILTYVLVAVQFEFL